MADIYTSTGNVGDIILAETIYNQVLEALQASTVVAPLVANYDLSGQRTTSFSIPTLGTVSASTIGETADLTSTAFTDTQAAITYGETGWMTIVSDKAREVNVLGDQLVSRISGNATMAIGRAYDASITALFGALNGGTGVGAAASTMSVKFFLSALYNLELNNVLGDYAAVLHPIQINSLRTAVAASSAVISPLFVARKADSTGFVGDLYGVNVYQANACATTGTAGARVGAMMGVGDMSPIALGIWRPARVELQRDASRRGTEIIVTSSFGTVEQRDAAGIKILAQ